MDATLIFSESQDIFSSVQFGHFTLIYPFQEAKYHPILQPFLVPISG